MTDCKLDCCKKYIDKGFIPIPVNYHKTFYIKKGKKVEKSEKAPLFYNWQNTKKEHALTKIQTCLRKNSEYNIGIVTGKASNIVVIDIDLPKNDAEKDGMKKWEEFEDKHGQVNTLTAKTPSGGRHYFFNYNQDAELLKGSTKVGGYSIDIRTNNNQVLVYPSKYDKGCYEWINDCDIIDMPKWLFEFLVDNTNDESPKNVRGKNINHVYKNNRNEFYIMEEKQVEQIKHILNGLPSKYHDNYDLWRNVAFALSSTSHDKLLPSFIEFSEKSNKYDYDSCISLWNSIKDNKSNNIRINSLIYWFQSYNRDDKTKFVFPLTKKYDPISKYKNHDKLNVKYTKTRDLTTKAKILDEVLENKIIFLKSATGTGKTKLYNHVLDKIYDDKLLSIVSRVCIAYKQKDDFSKIGIDSSIYSQSSYIENDMICQIDSIWKLKPELYIGAPLFLDEFNSICAYFISDTLKGKRKEVFEIFVDIILNASHIYCADADLSDMSIGFIFDIYNNCDMEIPKTVLLWNTIKNVNQKALFYNQQSLLEKDIFKSLSDRVPFILASDSYKHLKELLAKCDLHCKSNNIEDINKDFLIYTGEDGDTEDFYDINKKWKDKFVFFTPKIIYGLSYEAEKTNVYGMFYNTSINPLGMVQQITRCRRINELKIYIRDGTNFIKYNELDDVKKYNTEMNGIHNKFMNREKIGDGYLDKCYENLFAYNEYYNDVLFSYPKYHLQRLLEDKGFTVNFFEEEDAEAYDNTEAKKIIKEQRDNDVKNILENFIDKSVALTVKQENKKNKVVERMIYLSINTKQMLDNDRFIDILMNDTLYKQHLILCRAFLNDAMIKDKYIFFESREFKEHLWNNIYDKIMVMRHVEKYLGIESFNINGLVPSILETSKVNNLNDDVLTHMKELFKFKNISIKTDYDVYKYLIRMYCSLFGNRIVENVGMDIINRSKRCYKYDINTDFLLVNYNLMTYRTINRKVIDENVRNLLGIEIEEYMF